MSFFTGGGLVKRGRTYYIRVRVPDDLKRFITTKEIKQSLRTSSYGEATKLARAWRSALDHFFCDMRRERVTDTEILQLRDKFYRDTIEGDPRKKSNGIITEADAESWAVYSERMVANYRQGLITNNFRLVSYAVDKFLEGQGIVVDKNSDDYPYLCREFSKILVNAHEMKVNNARGIYVVHPPQASPPSSPLPASPPAPATDPAFSAQMEDIAEHLRNLKGSGGLFSEIVKKFILFQTSVDAWKPGTEEAMQEAFDLFSEAIGNKDITAYDTEDFLRFRTVLSKLPINRNKTPKFRDKTIAELLLMSFTEKTLSVDTMNKQLQRVSQLFAWAKARKFINTDYSGGISVKSRNLDSEKRQPYDNEELDKIVANIKAKKPATQFWVPLFGLYMGMRADEICQLYLEDIYEISGILCVDSTARRSDQSLKTKESSRIIPIHPFLLELGFMNYHKELREAGEERLWPSLKMRIHKVKEGDDIKAVKEGDDFKRGKGGYGAGWCSWYNEHFNRKHITQDPTKTFHSFRHNLPNLLEKIPTVKDFTLSKIMGHACKTETKRTYLKPDLEEMYAALAQAQYKIDLDILRDKSLWNKDDILTPHRGVNRKTIIRPAGKTTARRRDTTVSTVEAAKCRKRQHSSE